MDEHRIAGEIGPIPDGFRLEHHGPLWVVARPGLHAALARLVQTQPGVPERGRAQRDRLPSTLPAPHGGMPVAVRTFQHGGMLWNLAPLAVRRLYGSPARVLEELALYARARARGVPTLDPLGAVLHRRGPRRWQLALVTRWLEGSEDLRAPFGPETSPAERCAVWSAVGRSVAALHEAGFEHADLHVGNLLSHRNGAGAFTVTVIDLDRCRDHGRPLSPARRSANLLRLYRSIVKRHARHAPRQCNAELRAFLRAYAGPDAALRRELVRALRRYGPWLRARRLLWRALGKH